MTSWRRLDSAKRKYLAADQKAEKTLMEGLEATEIIYVSDEDWAIIQAELSRPDRKPELVEVFSKYALKEEK